MNNKIKILVILVIILIALLGANWFLFIQNKERAQIIGPEKEVNNKTEQIVQPPLLSENINEKVFQPNNLVWQSITTEANWSRRDAHTAVVFKDRMWVLGGVGGDYPAYNETKNDVWASNDGKNWTLTKDNAPWRARRGHTSVVFQDKIWIMGGATGEEIFLNDVWASADGIEWERITRDAGWAPRKGFSAVVFNNKIWIMSGASTRGVKNDVWYSEDGKTWNLAIENAAWSNRYDIDIEIFNNKLWLSGGIYTDGRWVGKRDVWVSSDGIVWELVNQQAPWLGRHGHCLVSFKDHLWIIGGWSGRSKGYNDTWFSKDGITWEKTTSLGPWQRREDHACLVFQNQIFLMGGMPMDGIRENDVWQTDNVKTP